MSLRRRLILLVVLLSPTTCASPVLAGAWTLAPGTSQAIVSLRHVEADRAFDRSGRLRTGGSYRKTEMSVFVEHGLAEGLTAFAQGTVQAKSVEAPVADERFGPDYTEFGLRARLVDREAVVLSAQGSLRLPGAGDPRAPAEIGATDLETDARLLAGRGFSAAGVEGWLDVQGGRRFRHGDPPDEWRVDATIGIRPAPRWTAMLQGFGSFAAGDARGPFPEARSIDLQGSVAREIAPRWTVQAGVVGTVWGREAAREVGGFVALWRRF